MGLDDDEAPLPGGGRRARARDVNDVCVGQVWRGARVGRGAMGLGRIGRVVVGAVDGARGCCARVAVAPPSGLDGRVNATGSLNRGADGIVHKARGA